MDSTHQRAEEYNALVFLKQSDAFLSGSTIQNQYRKAAKVWTLGQAAAILANISNLSVETRIGGTLLENTMFDVLLYQIIVKKGASINRIDKEEF